MEMAPHHSVPTTMTYVDPGRPGVVRYACDREVPKDAFWPSAFYLRPEAVLALHLRWSDVQAVLHRQAPSRGDYEGFCRLSIFDMERKVMSLVEEVNAVCLETERGLPSVTPSVFGSIPGVFPEKDILQGALLDRYYLHCSMQKLWKERDGSYFFTRELGLHFGLESVEPCGASDEDWTCFSAARLNRAQFAALAVGFGLHTYSIAARVAGEDGARLWSEELLRRVMPIVNGVLLSGGVQSDGKPELIVLES